MQFNTLPNVHGCDILCPGGVFLSIFSYSYSCQVTKLNREPLQLDNSLPIEGRVEQALEQWSQESDCREYVKFLRDYVLESNQAVYTQPFGSETVEHRNSRFRYAPNLAKKALSDLSTLYYPGCNREAAANQSRWEDVLWNFGKGLNALQRDTDINIRLLGTRLYQYSPWFENSPHDSKGTPNGIDIRTFDRDRFCLLSHPNDSRYVGAVLLLNSTHTDAEKGVLETFYYYDSEYLVKIVGTEIESKPEPNELGFIPCSVFKNDNSNCVYGLPFGGKDFVQNLQTVQQYIENLIFTGFLQRGQPVVKGKSPDGITLGQTTPVEVDENGDFVIVAPQGDIDGMISVFQLMLDTLAISWGMPKRTFNVKGAESNSAQVLYANRIDLIEDRTRREDLGSQWEKEIAKKSSKVWADWKKESLTTDIVYQFPQFIPPSTQAERHAELKIQADYGLADKDKLLSIVEPELTEKQRTEQLEQAEQERKIEVERQALVAGHINDTNQQVDDVRIERNETPRVNLAD